MFSQVSVCPQGGVCPIACWDKPPLPPAGTPPGRYTPSGQLHPPPPPLPPGRYTRPLCSACWDTVNKREVRIPLECTLVRNCNPNILVSAGEICNNFHNCTYIALEKNSSHCSRFMNFFQYIDFRDESITT